VNHGKTVQSIGGGKEYVVAVGAPGDGNDWDAVQDMLLSKLTPKLTNENFARVLDRLPRFEPHEVIRCSKE
jgi:hypothetical protein